MEATSQGRKVAWNLVAVIALVNVAGYAFDLYVAASWFDRLLHAATLFAVTLWLALFICASALRASRPFVAAALIASLGVAIGAWWEVAEWGFDAIAPGNVIKGKDDTLIDIIMDTVGAVAAAALAMRLMRASRTAEPYDAGASTEGRTA